MAAGAVDVPGKLISRQSYVTPGIGGLGIRWFRPAPGVPDPGSRPGLAYPAIMRTWDSVHELEGARRYQRSRPGLWFSIRRPEREAARNICRACPALATCREWALTTVSVARSSGQSARMRSCSDLPCPAAAMRRVPAVR